MKPIALALGIAKRLYQRARRLPDELLYERRHTRAIERLRARRAPARILVVCHGNICRSPYLAAVLQRDMPNVRVASAGFLRAERPVPEHSLVVSASRGFDLSAFRSRTITRTIAADADLVIVMDVQQARAMTRDMGVPAERVLIAGDLDPVGGNTRSVRDPWNQSIEVFESSFDRLDRCAATFVDALVDAARPSALVHGGRA